MVRFLLNLAFSVAITNWVYDELVLLEPNLKVPLDKLTQLITIPTHPHWFGGNGTQVIKAIARDAYYVVEQFKGDPRRAI
jgi:hypothetical protein